DEQQPSSSTRHSSVFSSQQALSQCISICAAIAHDVPACRLRIDQLSLLPVDPGGKAHPIMRRTANRANDGNWDVRLSKTTIALSSPVGIGSFVLGHLVRIRATAVTRTNPGTRWYLVPGIPRHKLLSAD